MSAGKTVSEMGEVTLLTAVSTQPLQFSHVPHTVTSLQQAYHQADCVAREFIKIFWYIKGIIIYNLQEFPKQMDSAQHIHPDTSFR